MWFLSIHPLIEVRVLREKISNGILMARDVFKGVVEVLKVFYPTSLAARYFVWLAKVLKIFVIGMNFNRFRCSQEEGMSHFKAKDDSHKFFIMSIIISLYGEEVLTVEPNRVNTIFELLSYNCTKCIARSIGF